MLQRLTLQKTTIKKLTLLGTLLAILPFMILSFFCHPAYDDYLIGAHVLKTGFIERQVDIYKTAGGRYFPTALITVFNPLPSESFAGYKAVALLIILLTFLSIFAFVGALLKSSFSRLDKLIAAGFLTALFCNQMPDVTESYYFMTGSIVYHLPNILTLFFFALVLKSSEKSKLSKLLLMLLCCALIIAIVGSTETSMLILALVVFPITIKTWAAKSDQRWWWLVFSVLTVICSAVVILAPGNAIRGSYYPGHHRFFYSLGMSLRQEVSFLLIWFSNFAFVLGTILFIPIAAGLSEKLPAFKRLRVNPILFSTALLLLIFLGLFPAYWSMGMMGQHRTITTVYFFFVIGWFINIALWVDYLNRRWGFKPADLPNYAYVIAVPLILCTLLFGNNTRVAIMDLVRGRAYRYDQAVSKRHVQYEKCAREGNIDNCAVESVSDLPTTITNPYYETEIDIQSEKQYWKAIAQSPNSR